MHQIHEHLALLLCGARYVAFSRVTLPNIGSTVSRQILQSNQARIGNPVGGEAIELGCFVSFDTDFAISNCVSGEYIVAGLEDVESSRSTFSDSVALDGALPARCVKRNTELGTVRDCILFNERISNQVIEVTIEDDNAVCFGFGNLIPNNFDSRLACDIYGDRGPAGYVDRIARDEVFPPCHQQAPAAATKNSVALEDGSISTTTADNNTIVLDISNGIRCQRGIITIALNTLVRVDKKAALYLIVVPVNDQPSRSAIGCDTLKDVAISGKIKSLSERRVFGEDVLDAGTLSRVVTVRDASATVHDFAVLDCRTFAANRDACGIATVGCGGAPNCVSVQIKSDWPHDT